MKIRNVVFAAATLVVSAAAFAAPHCTDAPKSSWMSEDAMKQQIAQAGFAVDKFKISGNCYEIYGKSKDGAKVEIYFNPVDGSIVKERRNRV